MVMEEKVTAILEGSGYLAIVGCWVRLMNSQRDWKFQYCKKGQEWDVQWDISWAWGKWTGIWKLCSPTTSDSRVAKIIQKVL